LRSACDAIRLAKRMSDIFSKRQRSEIMSKVRSSGNAATELRLIAIFRAFKLRGWRRKTGTFGNPDFVFHSARLAVFVDGCFWHGCEVHRNIPKTNKSFWSDKIARNKRRDARVRRVLNDEGWSVLRIWQHDLKYPDRVARRVHRTLLHRRSKKISELR
jgi:DNA mismatch endonuclease (patch repair protein)